MAVNRMVEAYKHDTDLVARSRLSIGRAGQLGKRAKSRVETLRESAPRDTMKQEIPVMRKEHGRDTWSTCGARYRGFKGRRSNAGLMLAHRRPLWTFVGVTDGVPVVRLCYNHMSIFQ